LWLIGQLQVRRARGGKTVTVRPPPRPPFVGDSVKAASATNTGGAKAAASAVAARKRLGTGRGNAASTRTTSRHVNAPASSRTRSTPQRPRKY